MKKPNLAALEASLSQRKPASVAPEPKPAPSYYVPPSRVGKKHIPVYASETQWRTLKQLSLDIGEPVQGLMLDALADLLRKHGRPATD